MKNFEMADIYKNSTDNLQNIKKFNKEFEKL